MTYALELQKSLPRQRWWAGLLLALGLAGCSTPLRHAPAERSAPHAIESAAPAASAMAPHRPQAQSTLGTQWGEGRESASSLVQATRLTPAQPRAVGQMRYSDEASIRRALGPHAQSQLNTLLADGDVEMHISSGNGPSLRVFSTRGAQDYHVAGRHGERYELVYLNRSSRDYEVVATVDGLDVLTGQPGSVDHLGYLLRAGERLVIDGFRKNRGEVAAFRFSSPDRAYASNTAAGDSRNVGVIGTALFEVRLDGGNPEQPRHTPPAPSSGPRAFPADAGPYAAPPQYRR